MRDNGREIYFMGQPEFLSLRHASIYIDMPVGTLRKRYMRGHIEYIQDPYSKRIYFCKKELARYMRQGEQKNVVARLWAV